MPDFKVISVNLESAVINNKFVEQTSYYEPVLTTPKKILVATEYETIYSVQISFNGMHDDQVENNLMNIIQAAINNI